MGLVTVSIAFPNPAVQSILTTGDEGDTGCAEIGTVAETADVQFEEFVTVKL
jgi:hypothetical protein